MMNDKRGQTSFGLFWLIFIGFFALIFLFAIVLVVVNIDSVLDQDIELGQVNLRDVNNDTFGPYADMVKDNADWWGISTIFGMIFGLFLSSYILRGRFPKWGMVLDVFIIFASFIISLYISASVQLIIDVMSSTGITAIQVYTPRTAMFLLNLPIFVVIIGVICMVLFHSSIPKRSEENIQKGGFLQGVN